VTSREGRGVSDEVVHLAFVEALGEAVSAAADVEAAGQDAFGGYAACHASCMVCQMWRMRWRRISSSLLVPFSGRMASSLACMISAMEREWVWARASKSAAL